LTSTFTQVHVYYQNPRNESECFGYRKHGAEVVFIGTRAGLTRLLSLTDVKAGRQVQ